jgi:hypothetical protein
VVQDLNLFVPWASTTNQRMRAWRRGWNSWRASWQRRRPSSTGSSVTHRLSTSGPFDHPAARWATSLNGRRPFSHLVAPAAFDGGAGQARARPSLVGEDDLGRRRSSRMEYTAGSRPCRGPCDQSVNAPGCACSSSPCCPSLLPTVTLAPRHCGGVIGLSYYVALLLPSKRIFLLEAAAPFFIVWARAARAPRQHRA